LLGNVSLRSTALANRLSGKRHSEEGVKGVKVVIVEEFQ
jgi:hypothetical protein